MRTKGGGMKEICRRIQQDPRMSDIVKAEVRQLNSQTQCHTATVNALIFSVPFSKFPQQKQVTR